MLKELGELPAALDALIEGLVGFLYRILASFWIVIAKPWGGAIKVQPGAGSRYLKPLTMLLIAAGLLSLTSVVLPDDVPQLLHQKESALGYWLFDTLVLLLMADAIVNVSCWIGYGPLRRPLAVGTYRYCAAFALLFWCVEAFVFRLHDGTIALPFAVSAPVWAKAIVASKAYSRIAWFLAMLPMFCNGLKLGLNDRDKHVKVRQALTLALAYLGFAGLSLSPLPGAMETIEDHLRQMGATEAKPAFPTVRPTEPMVVLTTCPRPLAPHMAVSAAVSNPTASDIALDTSRLQFMVFYKESDIGNPRAERSAMIGTGDPIVILPAHRITVIRGAVKVGHVADLNPDGCDLDLNQKGFR